MEGSVTTPRIPGDPHGVRPAEGSGGSADVRLGPDRTGRQPGRGLRL